MSLGGDPLAGPNSAMQAYDEICAKQLYKTAKSLYKKGNYVGSQEACEKLYALKPNDLNIVILLSASYYRQGKHDKSLEILHKVPKDYRKCVEVVNNIAANYLKKNQYSEACNAYYIAVCIKKDFVECWLGYIITLIKMDQNENAIRSLNMILHAKPDVYQLYILCGRLMIKLKRFDEAHTQFQKAIQLEPESDASWTGMADSFAFRKKFYSAIVCYQKALELNRALIYPHINIGFMFYQLQQFDKAIFFLKTAIQMSPTKTINILPILGDAYFYNGNNVAAMKTYSLYMKYQFNNAVVLHKMGLIYLNHFGNAAAAEPYFKFCIALDKKNALYYKSLTIVYYRLDKKDLAFKTATKWAEIQMLKNDYIGGISALCYASNLCPKNYYSHWKLVLISQLLVNKLELNRRALLR